LASEYPTLASVKNEVESEVNAYIHSLTLLSSLREYFQSKGIECHIEPKIRKKNGDYNTPDLLLHSNNFLIVDHKYTESIDQRTLSNKINDMKKYDKLFLLPDDESQTEVETKPEVVMLAPAKSTPIFKTLSNCPITWGYVLEENIELRQSIGSVKDTKILSLFTPTISCPLSTEIAKYKFIISHPPTPYTAVHVYSFLWNLIQPTQFFAPEFEVKYDDVLTVFNSFFPPWLRPEIRQMSVKRLEEALDLLQKVGWIRWYKQEGLILVDRTKGRLIPDISSYLIDNFVKIEHARRVKKYEGKIKERKILEKGPGQTSIMDFFR
jgi:hypothetical protein